ncbi:MAG: beta-ketoacyl synthase chain length factor [Gammaproteobacteria bacterium]
MTEVAVTFSIASWAAWAPGIQDLTDWSAWIRGERTGLQSDQPDVSFLPPLLRRRLDRVGRMALYVAWQCAGNRVGLPLVFASRHGFLARTVQLLDNLAQHETLSPAAFSLSVHNSAAGLFSICRDDRSPSTALAAGGQTLAAAILEGIGMLIEGRTEVLVVYTDEIPPPEYTSYLGMNEPDFAVGMLLAVPNRELPQYRLIASPGVTNGRQLDVALMELLVEDVPILHLSLGESDLQLVRVDEHLAYTNH